MEKEKNAIFNYKGKQYRVHEGDEIDVDLSEFAEGQELSFTEVLYLNDGEKILLGAPHVDGAEVKGELIEACIKGDKIISYKYKRRHNYHRKVGHRQKYTRVKVTTIASKA